jgi:peptidoglycan/LPS O-acetylase OafA/YrhL
MFLSTRAHLGACGVDLFFIISGFIMAMIANDVSWHRFLFDRVTRIYPPYWFYTSLVLAVFLLSPDMVNSSFGQAPSLWRSYLLIPDRIAPLLAVGWTLIHEMYFYLCFAFILMLIGKFKFPLHTCLLLWAMVIIILNLLFHVIQNTHPVIAVLIHPLTFEFIGGAITGLIIRKGYQSLALLIMAGGMLCAITVFQLPDACNIAVNLNWLHIFFIGTPCALIVYGAVAMELNGISIAPKWLVAIGDASYSIYLGHVLVLSAIGRLYAMLHCHNACTEVLFVIVCIGSANSVGLFSHHVIERKTLRYTRSKWMHFDPLQ